MAVGKGATILLGAAIAGCGQGAGSVPGSPTIDVPVATAPPGRPATASPTPTLPPSVVKVIPIGEPVFGIASAGESIWVEADYRLVQLDGSTGAQLQELEGWFPTVRDDKLWYIREEELVQADATSGRELKVFTPSAVGTTVEDGVLWADDEEAGQLLAIELSTGKTEHELQLPNGEAKWIVLWEGAVWVVIDGSGGIIVRLDPDTGRVIDELDAGIRPHSVTMGFGSLWITDHGKAQVLRFGPDGTLEASIAGPGMNVGITATTDAIWAAGPSGLHEIDPTTNAIVQQIHLGRGDWYGLASSGEFIWLTSADAGNVYQIDPRA